MRDRKPYFDYGAYDLIVPHKTWPTLYSSRADSKGIQEWTIRVDCKDEGGLITGTFGTINGQKQVQTKLIKDGKNAGRKNATSPFEQAAKEAFASWTRKQEREGYKPDTNLLSDDEMRPMLAEVYWDHVEHIDWGQAYAQPKFDGFRCLA